MERIPFTQKFTGAVLVAVVGALIAHIATVGPRFAPIEGLIELHRRTSQPLAPRSQSTKKTKPNKPATQPLAPLQGPLTARTSEPKRQMGAYEVQQPPGKVISAMTGTLRVITNKDAVVAVDGIPVSGSAELRPGEYVLTFSYPALFGATPHRQAVLIEPGIVTEARYYFMVGSLRYECSPAETTEVFIDGRLVGSRGEGEIPMILAGGHTLSIARADYPEFTADFNVPSGGQKILKIVYNFTSRHWQLR